MARLAWSTTLDRNSSYAYLLWCRDFAATSVVAATDAEPEALAGFVTAYLRPDDPGTLFVWQVAVDDRHRGRGLARAMVDHLLDRVGPSVLEATVTRDNHPSRALFGAVARDRGVSMEERDLFDVSVFPDDHAGEQLIRIVLRKPS